MTTPFIPGVFNKISREVFEQPAAPVVCHEPEDYKMPSNKNYSFWLLLLPVLIIMLCGIGGLLWMLLERARIIFYA